MDWGKLGQTGIDYAVGGLAVKAGNALSSLSNAANKLATEKLGKADASALGLRSTLGNPPMDKKVFVYAGIAAVVLLAVIMMLHKGK